MWAGERPPDLANEVTTKAASVSEQLELPVAERNEQRLDRAPVFRPIHYLGSKLRLVDPIRALVSAVDQKDGAVCDLFAGSGTVSMAFAQERSVVAVDIQEYSRVICSAVLRPENAALKLLPRVADVVHHSARGRALFDAIAPLVQYESFAIKQAIGGNPVPLCDLLENGSLLIAQRELPSKADPKLQLAIRNASAGLAQVGLLTSDGSMVLRHFGGIYFSYHQAAEIDLILEGIHACDRRYRDSLLAPLLSTASDIVNTVGKHFAQPIRPRSKKGLPKRHLIRKIDEDRAIDAWATYELWCERYAKITGSNKAHQAICADYRDALETLPESVSVVYADPPYTRDHYSRFYHVLETLCFRDDPSVSSMTLGGARTVSRGLYRESRHQSPFCIKSQAPEAFEALFKGVRGRDIPLIVSYSPFAAASGARPRLMSIEGIKALAERYFQSVEVSSAGRIAHSKLNSAELNVDINYDAEVFLVCVP